MNSEESRLRSFDRWASNRPVCTAILAASGFYATENLFEVECHWCHCTISDWEFDEPIEQHHVRLSPHCDFIVNKHNCGNIPLPPRDVLGNQDNCGSVTKNNVTLDLLIEKDRLATFLHWPNPNITPLSLAKAGFFYRNRSDEVECAWCKGVIAQWEKEDNAFEEHRRFFPDCPRVQLGPLIEIANDGIRDLGIQQISPPKNPKYSSLQARLRTYSNWPIPDIQKPEDLAQAGLYYQNVDDQVRCFHCNMGLRLWEKQDDAWFEHAKWYPMCEFVRLVKGLNYIQEVQELTRTAETADNLIVPQTIEEAMLAEPVKIALEMGINSDTLRSKVQKKISETGSQYQTIDELLKAVFDDEESPNSGLANLPETSTEIHQANVSNTEHSESRNSTRRNSIGVERILERTCDFTPIAATNILAIKNKSVLLNSEDNFKINQKEKSSPVPATSEIMTLDPKFLEEENRKLKDARLCKVCLDEEVGVVYLPCGHLVTCVQCAPGVNLCPMCRTKIKGFVRTYLS